MNLPVNPRRRSVEEIGLAIRRMGEDALDPGLRDAAYILYFLEHWRPLLSTFLDALNAANTNGLLAPQWREHFVVPTLERLKDVVEALQVKYGPHIVRQYLERMYLCDPTFDFLKSVITSVREQADATPFEEPFHPDVELPVEAGTPPPHFPVGHADAVPPDGDDGVAREAYPTTAEPSAERSERTSSVAHVPEHVGPLLIEAARISDEARNLASFLDIGDVLNPDALCDDWKSLYRDVTRLATAFGLPADTRLSVLTEKETRRTRDVIVMERLHLLTTVRSIDPDAAVAVHALAAEASEALARYKSGALEDATVKRLTELATLIEETTRQSIQPKAQTVVRLVGSGEHGLLLVAALASSQLRVGVDDTCNENIASPNHEDTADTVGGKREATQLDAKTDDSGNHNAESSATHRPTPLDEHHEETSLSATRDVGGSVLPSTSKTVVDKTPVDGIGDARPDIQGSADIATSPKTIASDGGRDVAPTEHGHVAALPKGIDPSNLGSSPLVSWEGFQAEHWVGALGQVEQAPWISSDFVARLNLKAEGLLSMDSLALAYVLQHACESLGGRPIMASALLSEVGLAVRDVQRAVSAHEESHINRILEGTYTVQESRIGLLVDVLRWNQQLWISEEDIVEALRRAAYQDPVVSGIVRCIGIGATRGLDLRPIVRRRLSVSAGAADAMAQFDDELRQLRHRSNEGNVAFPARLRTEHCRKSWRDWKEGELGALLKIVLTHKSTTWNRKSIREQLSIATTRADAIFDRALARFEDRIKMNREAKALTDSILTLLRLSEQIEWSAAEDSTSIQDPGIDLPDQDALKEWTHRNTLPDAVEELCRQTLLAGIDRQPVDPLLLTSRDLVRWPSIVAYLGLAAPVDLEVFAFDVRDIPSPCPAAAVILGEPNIADANAADDEQIREVLVALDRLDVLSYYLGERSVGPSERTRFQRQLDEQGPDRVQRAFARLSTIAAECDQLLAPSAAEVERVLREAKPLVDAIENRPHGEALILHKWIDECLIEARRIRDRAIDALRTQAAMRGADVQQYFDDHLASERYWLLPGIAHGDTDTHMHTRQRWRQVAARPDAEASWREDGLRRLSAVVAEPVKAFLNHWNLANPVDTTQRECRKGFVELALGDANRSKKYRSQTGAGRDNRHRWFRVDCLPVLEDIDRQQLNPFFVPQLTRFATLLVVTAPALNVARASSFPGQCAQHVAESIESASQVEGGHQNMIVVMLAPNIPTAVRRDVVHEFRKRRLAAALIDDVDIGRMLGDAGEPPSDARKFLELVIEQLPLLHPQVSPFTSQDGQFLPPELFVGRADVAKQLALDHQYTRVYSGRRLGKSALMKYVANRYDSFKLPTKGTLRVVFHSIAGVDSEDVFADQVIRAMQTALRFDENPADRKSANPGDRLQHYLQRYLHQHRDVSLLLLLDEADSFVEQQLNDFRLDHERCLSFRLLKQFVNIESSGVPRLRAVMCGYRLTNTNDGPWANAGEVLRLTPLADDEAEQLIAEPLARLGIDVSQHASYIARRCGNQPAVIQKFGATLLAEIAKRTTLLERDYISVTSEQVTNAFKDEAVSNDIRQVIFNNFQQNPVGHIVFVAALQAFSRLSPGFELSDPEDAILEQLRAMDPDLGWLKALDPSLVGVITRQLKDFHVRQLIVRDQTSGKCRLRVAHSLQVLLTGDLAANAQRHIASLRAGHGVSDTALHRSILTESQLDDAQFAFEQPLYRGVLVTGLWRRPLEDDRVGMADRLGISPVNVIDRSLVAARGLDGADSIAILRATTADLESVVAGGYKARLLVGGVDLARRQIQHDMRPGEPAVVWWVAASRAAEISVRWWFERIRGLSFYSTDAIERICALTGRSMVFLELFDEVLREVVHDEQDVTKALLERAVTLWEGRLPHVANDLKQGEPDRKLEVRELEVLRMACLMAEAFEGLDLTSEFTASVWSDVAPPGWTCSPPTDDDQIHLRLLEQVGLLAPENGRLIYDARTPDPIFKLAKMI